MSIRLVRLFALACTLALVAPLAAGCARTPDEGQYTELAAESYRTTLAVASEIFTTYERLEEASPLPPEPMAAEVLDGMDKRIDGWKKAIEQEERRLSSVEPPAGYTLVHEDLLAIDQAMIASLELLAEIESRRPAEWDLGDLRREVNRAFYDDTELAFDLNDILPKVASTSDTLGVYPDDNAQLQEIMEEGGW